jgi:hypothetical protein
MPFPGGTYLSQLTGAVKAELDQFYALLEGYLRVQHNEDGTHAAITADSVTATGDGTFAGDLIARSGDADGECTLGDVGAVDDGLDGIGITGGVRLGGDTGWVVGVKPASSPGTSTDTEVRIWDLNNLVAGVSALRLFYYTASSFWTLGIEAGGALALGENASGKRLSEVNAIAVTASSTVTTATATASTITQTARLSLTTRNTHALTASVNDLAIQGPRVVLSSNGAYNITGIVAGVDGELLWLVNNSGSAITLKNNDGASAAANRLVGANAADVVLRANNGSALLIYDTTSAVWFITGA